MSGRDLPAGRGCLTGRDLPVGVVFVGQPLPHPRDDTDSGLFGLAWTTSAETRGADMSASGACMSPDRLERLHTMKEPKLAVYDQQSLPVQVGQVAANPPCVDFWQQRFDAGALPVEHRLDIELYGSLLESKVGHIRRALRDAVSLPDRKSRIT